MWKTYFLQLSDFLPWLGWGRMWVSDFHELFPVDLVHLQSKFFPAKFFFCILEKGILAGKKSTLQKSGFTLQRRLFVLQSTSFSFKLQFIILSPHFHRSSFPTIPL
jgi:hypothetical protein